MTAKNRYGHITRLFCFLLALHFFNFSIDPKDVHPDSMPEDLSINDIESVVEFLAEVVFNHKDAFVEHDEKDHENGSPIDSYKLYCTNTITVIDSFSPAILSIQKFGIADCGKVQPASGSVIIPPPRG